MSLDKTGIPTNNNSNTENKYSVEITDYIYHKITNIDNDGDFTNDDIIEYGLEVSNDKISISNTNKLINYLKSFVKVCVKSVKSEHDNFVENMEDEISRLDNLLDSLEENILDKMYPIGCVYMTFSSDNPSVIFGGNWIKLEDRFLLGSGSKSIGVTGGEETHELTVEELPSHSHTQNPHKHQSNGGWKFLTSDDDVMMNNIKRSLPAKSNDGVYLMYSATTHGGIGQNTSTNEKTGTNNNTGGSQSHNNMPPYQVVHMWRRVS